jgi:hypothetical protein
MHICTLHMLGMGGVSLALVPSILARSSLLACNAAVPNVHASAWPLINTSVLMFCLSWMACSLLHHTCGMHKLALCTSMHMVARLVASFAHMAVACPLPPIFMPAATAATGMACSMGFVLLFISQGLHDGSFTSEEFYMHHAWACCVMVLLARHTVFRGAAWVVCGLQRAFLRHVVERETSSYVVTNGHSDK